MIHASWDYECIGCVQENNELISIHRMNLEWIHIYIDK
jgi:hypothetical protein